MSSGNAKLQEQLDVTPIRDPTDPFRHQFYMEGTFASVAALRAAAHCDAEDSEEEEEEQGEDGGGRGGQEEEEGE